MSDARHIQNIALIGFMGTGKSSVANLVASALQLQKLDTDEMIESRAGKRIAEIFSDEGEAAFRKLERQVVLELEDESGVIIATGGGLATGEGNLASLKKHALTVCLWASVEAILSRVGHQTNRPLLNVPDPLAKIRELLAAREPFYKQADVLLNTDLRSPREVAMLVVHHFRSAHEK